ncbi:MAG: hypothetical protein IJ720_06780 [Clostridia bacterium]|nr:hypothetical protein [Clostridia bacterium]
MFLNNDRDPVPGLWRYEILPGEPVDEFSFSMLSQNPPEGVLRLGRETTEEFDHLLLPVSNLVKLTDNVPIVVSKVTEDKLLLQVEEVKEQLSRYMIPAEELVLRPEWTFRDPKTGTLTFLVLPTALAKDLSLPVEDYVFLLRHALEKRTEEAKVLESAKGSAKEHPKGTFPEKTLRERVREFWGGLD